MSDLLFSILSSTCIFLTFKITGKFKTELPKLITINYLVAAILGFSFNQQHFSFLKVLFSPWIPYAVVIGLIFIAVFFLMGRSTRQSGMAVTTIAGKMSVVIPMLFSVLLFHERLGFLKMAGLVLSVSAVFLTSFKPLNNKSNIKLILLPVAIFFGTGIADSTVKYAQNQFVSNAMSMLFSAFVFLTCFVFGVLNLVLHSRSSARTISVAELIGGSVLGVVNFGSLYFFIRALNNSRFDSSVVFGLNSLFIVLLSVLAGAGLFHEKLSKINFAGIALAILAILTLMSN